MAQIDPARRLFRDLLKAAESLGLAEARYLVDLYYQIQEYRKASANQVLSLAKSGEPHTLIEHFAKQTEALEEDIKLGLDAYTASDPLAAWARGHVGVGPVIAAGLRAHIDISRVTSVGQIWRFAGMDDPANYHWGKGELRPYNADLKVLCWKLGDSFMKHSGRENAFYGHLWRQRKDFELARDAAVREVPGEGWYQVETPTPAMKRGAVVVLSSETNVEAVPIGDKWFAGGNAKAAARTLATKNMREPKVLAVYRTGRLPDGRIDQRAKRWAVKLFLAHYFEEGWRQLHGTEPPEPYPIAHLGHVDRILAPATT